MKFYSTNNTTTRTSFKDAVFNSMPQDKGLYMPVEIPRLSDKFLSHLISFYYWEGSYLLPLIITLAETGFIIQSVINKLASIADSIHLISIGFSLYLSHKDCKAWLFCPGYALLYLRFVRLKLLMQRAVSSYFRLVF